MVTATELYNRKTIIPTDLSNKENEAVRRIQEERLKKEQYSHYERQAEPIKKAVINKLNEKIREIEEKIKHYNDKINRYQKAKNEEREASYRRDYERIIDEARYFLNAYSKGLEILKKEKEEFEKKQDPLEILGNSSYADEVIKYSRDVIYYEKDKARAALEEQKNLEKFRQSEDFKKLKEMYGLSDYASRWEINKAIEKSKVEGVYNLKTGEFYPTKNKEWVPPGSKKEDLVYIPQYYASWNRVEKNLGDGSYLIQLQNPKNKDEIINLKVESKATEEKELKIPLPETDVQPYPYPTNKIPKELAMKQTTTYSPEGKPLPNILTLEEGINKSKTIEYLSLTNKSFYEVYNLSNLKWEDAFKLNPLPYNTEVALRSLAKITERDYQNLFERSIKPKFEAISLDYEKEINKLFSEPSSLYDPSIDKKIKELNNEYEKKVKELEENFVNNEGKRLIEEREKLLGKFADKTIWKQTISIPKLTATAVASYAASYFMAPALVGAYGGLAKGAAVAVTALGTGNLVYSTANIINRLVEEHNAGSLTKEKVFNIVGPTALVASVSIAGGIAGSYKGLAKYNQARAEFNLNINKQLAGNEALQKKIFTAENLNRGYAEIPYNNYKMRLAINENMYQKLQIQNIFLREGGTKYGKGLQKTEYVGLSYEKGVLLKDKLIKELGLKKDSLVLDEGGLKVIKNSIVSAKTGIVGKEKLWYSINGRYLNRPIEVLFNYTKTGKITNPHIVIKTQSPLNQNVFLVTTAKIIKKPAVTKTKNNIEVYRIQVEPIGTKIVIGKKVKSSVLDNNNIIIERAKYEFLSKKLFGKTEREDFYNFIVSDKLIKIDKSKLFKDGIIERGSLDVLEVSKTKPLGEIDFYKKIGLFKGKTREDIFNFLDIKKTPLGYTKTPLSKTFSKTEANKPLSELWNDKGVKSLTKTEEIVKTDYILGNLPKLKTDNIKIKISPLEKEKAHFSSLILSPKIKKTEITKPQTKPLSLEKSVNKERIFDMPKQKIGSFSIEKKDNKQNIKPNTLTKTSQKLVLKPLQKSLNKDIFSGLSNLKLTTPTSSINLKPKMPQIPLIKIKPTSFSGAKNIKVKKSGDIFDFGYITEVRRKGKFIPVSGVLSKEEALKTGEMVARKTLAATFRIKKTNEKVKNKEASYWGMPEDFYKKGDLFIQRREKRLSTKGEVGEIQRARKKTKSFLDIWR
ncbi:MAG: hypothetical protein NC935_02145 [Candidatus Omnitrophica bacterium]|nr:hypothetical protein [Candidatus Omnitrophota bacterium]